MTTISISHQHNSYQSDCPHHIMTIIVNLSTLKDTLRTRNLERCLFSDPSSAGRFKAATNDFLSTPAFLLPRCPFSTVCPCTPPTPSYPPIPHPRAPLTRSETHATLNSP
eukprot:6187729-Pleurochrysis_carterae.AAC.1